MEGYDFVYDASTQQLSTWKEQDSSLSASLPVDIPATVLIIIAAIIFLLALAVFIYAEKRLL